MTRSRTPEYSFVLPVYNEEETLPEMHRRMAALLDRLDGPSEVVLVDDGSKDRSYALMRDIHRQDPRFKVLRLSRNFGHQIAISAGMDHVSGRATIIMDADLQDPPEVVLEMVDKWKQGYEVVYAVRETRAGESWFKLGTAKAFYRLLDRLSDIEIPHDVGDFRLIDRKALDAFRALRENNRYVRGMFSWIGFEQTAVRYARHPRFAGTTKYPLKKMLRFATDGILSFSTSPLRVVLTLGFLISAASFVAGLVALYLKLSGSYTVRGWTSLALLVTFIGGTQLIVLGILGEYIGRIHAEVKQRPLYLVRRSHGIADAADLPDLPEIEDRMDGMPGAAGAPDGTEGGEAAGEAPAG